MQTFENILNVQYRFPDLDTPEGKNFTPEAIDLIKCLLLKEPYMRLGAGRPGSINDY